MTGPSIPADSDERALPLIWDAFASGAREAVIVFSAGWLGGFVYWQLHAPPPASPFERIGNVVVAALVGGLGGLTLLVGQLWVILIAVLVNLIRSNLVAATAVLAVVTWEASVAVELLARTPILELPSQPLGTILVVVMLLGFAGALAVFVPMVVVVGAWWVLRK